MADIVEANREIERLKAENQQLATAVEACRKLVAATPVPPKSITWEKGVELLNMLQDEVCPLLRSITEPRKETNAKDDTAGY